jgi:hypothetical protein
MTELEVDFADVTTIAGTVDEKLQHAVEAFNWVDRGTSRPVASRISDAFSAVGVIRTCAAVVQEIGLPQRLRCDRDSRFVGNTHAADFPAPFMRFWMNLAVALDVCPPHSPQLKPYVERYNRAFKEECLAKYHPRTVAAAQACADRFRTWYCEERPHQGDACGNQPPAVAFPDLPAMRPIPETVDPDGWLRVVDGMALVRRVNRSGAVAIDTVTYYVGKALAGQEVTFQIDASAREFRILQHEREIKRLTIRRLIGEVVTFDQMVEQLCQLAERTEAQLHSRQRHRRPRNCLRYPGGYGSLLPMGVPVPAFPRPPDQPSEYACGYDAETNHESERGTVLPCITTALGSNRRIIVGIKGIRHRQWDRDELCTIQGRCHPVHHPRTSMMEYTDGTILTN